MSPRFRRLTLLFAAGAGLAALIAISLNMPRALAQSDPFLAPPPAATTGPTPVIVELFTSEGCSSCPPADDLLADLLATQPVRGALILPLSLHVDYWNDLGWTDRFSKPQFTSRQRAYAQTFGSNRVYTPQMIVDGIDEFTGSDLSRALAAIEKAATRPHLPVTIRIEPAPRISPASDSAASDSSTPDASSSNSSARIVRLRIDGLDTLRDRNADVVLALTQASVESDVTRGENTGRQLRHVAVVRSLQRLADSLGDDPSAEFTAPLELDPAWDAASLSAVAFVQAHQGSRILGAASAPL